MYTIETKQTEAGETIYTAKPPMGVKLRYPIGYFATEEAAIEAYNNAIQ